MGVVVPGGLQDSMSSYFYEVQNTGLAVDCHSSPFPIYTCTKVFKQYSLSDTRSISR
jgi:hypothetical protein